MKYVKPFHSITQSYTWWHLGQHSSMLYLGLIKNVMVKSVFVIELTGAHNSFNWLDIKPLVCITSSQRWLYGTIIPDDVHCSDWDVEGNLRKQQELAGAFSLLILEKSDTDFPFDQCSGWLITWKSLKKIRDAKKKKRKLTQIWSNNYTVPFCWCHDRILK